ncbi:MAG TPA: TonB-dependent receptor [Caulobacteraceae bacterium]
MMSFKSRLLSRSADVRAWRALMATAVVAAGVSVGGAAFAADAAATVDADKGVEQTADYGNRVSELTVVGTSGAVTAGPTKAPLQATEPMSIITHDAIDQFVAQTADYTEVILLSPSVSGISFNGPGLYEAKSTLRGFSDGQYNVTYDGIPFADTNDPTHHSTSFFPSSNIGAVTVERGPGAAGQLGQANFGGSVNIFSPEVGDSFGASEQVTYGSWNTFQTVSRLNTGDIAQLNGTHALLALSGLRSDGYLTYSGAYGLNIMARAVVPLKDSWKVTLFATLNHTHVYQDDNNGATLAQVALHGKTYALNNIPGTNQYYKINQVNKHTDFEYVRLNGDVTPQTHLENTVYTYYYDNRTLSPQDVTDTVTPVVNPTPDPKLKSSVPGLPGYTKFNHYRVTGDILRVTQDLGFGTLKTGVWVEHSGTHRSRYDYNLTTVLTPTVPDYKEKTSATITAPQNISYDQHSSWDQVQPFVDFEWRVTPALTITPGFKYLHFTRHVWGPYNQGVRNGNAYSDTFNKPLYFATANYKIQDNWTTYFQFATGFLEPPLSVLQTNSPNVTALKPQETRNYQLGTVFHSSRVTFDADVYYITFDNLISSAACGGAITNCQTGDTVFFNVPGAIYKGIEGQITFQVIPHVDLFANGSVNSAKSEVTHLQIAGAPSSTAAIGVQYREGPWSLSVIDKYVGQNHAVDVSDTGAASLATYNAYTIKAYYNTDLKVVYNFGSWRLEGALYNLFNSQQVTKISAGKTIAADQYYFQPGRSFQLSAKVNF